MFPVRDRGIDDSVMTDDHVSIITSFSSSLQVSLSLELSQENSCIL
jgi:hypothetical protein